MSTIASLGFDISSSWNGKGVAGAADDLTKLKAAIDSINGKSVAVQVDDKQAKTSIDDLKAGLDMLAETHATATADVDAQREALDMLKADLDEFAAEHKTATADVNAQKAALDELKADLDKFASEHATATADVNASGRSSLDELKLSLESFGRMHETAHADVDTDSATSGLRGLTTASEDAGRGLSGLGGAAGGASGGLSGAGSAAAGAGGNMNFFVAALGVLVTLIAALLPALGGLAIGLLGMGAAFGVAYLALKPIIGALQDFGAAQQQAGQSSAQMAAQQHANATAIANAQQAIVQAQQQATQTQVTGAMQVQAAQQNLKQSYMSLADAQRQQGFQALQSANSLISAEQAVTNAQIADTQATQALTQARIDAKNAMDNLNNSVADAGLSVRSAQLQLLQAQQNQSALGPNATALQQAQAQLAVDQARQAIIDQQTRLKQLQQQQAASQKAGIDGSSQVVSATNAVRLADLNVLNTERALQMARITAANTAISSAQAVTRAQDNVAQSQLSLQRAQEQAAFSNQQAQQRVVQAQRAYNDLLVQQKLQMQATAAASPYGKFQQDMANLTPAGRNLVSLLTQQKGLLTGLSQTAQNAFLPGFTQFVKDGIKSLPTLNGAITTFGQGFGGFMGKLGDWAASPMAQGQFNQIIKSAAGFMGDLGDATLKLAPSFTAFLTASGPAAQALGQGIGEIIGTGLPAMFNALTPYIQSGSLFLRQFLGLISDLLPILGTMGGLLSELFGPLMGPLRQLIQAVAGALTPALQALIPPVAQIIADFIDGLLPVVKVLSPIIQLFALGLSAILRFLGPLVPILTPLVAGLWLLNAALLANPAILIATGITILIGAIVYLATKTRFFQDVWNAVWSFAKQIFDDAVKFLRGPFGELVILILGPVGAALWLAANWQKVMTALKDAWNAFWSFFKPIWTDSWNVVKTIASGVWDVIIGAWDLFQGKLTTGVQKLVDGVKSIWNGIVDVFKTPINAVIAIWNTVGGVFGLPHVNPIGNSSNNPAAGGASTPSAGHGALLAQGGHVTGPGSETSDSIPAWLSHNEYVMPAHAVRRWGLPFMEAVRGGGPAGGSGNGFFLGGLVDIGKSLFNDAKGILGSGLNALKNVGATIAYDTARPILDRIISAIPHPIPGIAEPFGDVIYDAAKTVEGSVLGLFKGKQDAAKQAGSVISSGVGAVAAGMHKQIIDQALKAAGVPADQWPRWEAGMNVLIQRESAWNPNAINNWDINAKNGVPSQGLAQVIPPTFRTYHASGTSMNILDPVANVAAAIRYILSRYHDISNVQQANPNEPPKGYALGTLNAARGWSIVGEQGPEAVYFGGGETVRSFPDTMAAIGAGASNMKALVKAVGEGGHHGDVNVEIEININGTGQASAQEIVDEVEADLVPQLTMLLRQKVGDR